MMLATGCTAPAIRAASTVLLLLLSVTGCASSGSELVPAVPEETARETALPTFPAPDVIPPELPEFIPPEPAPGESTIVYSVDGTGTASVNYMTVQAGTVVQESLSGTTLPFTKSMTVADGGVSASTALTLVAVGNETPGTLSCTITEDGTVVAEQTATGAFAAVTCTATVR